MADQRQEALERVERDPRRQWGWGTSELASPEERAAYEMYVTEPLVRSGQLPVSALPEEYGGRPTGTTRRDMRMRAEWDAAQQQQLENMRIMQQIEESNARMEEEERQRNVAMLAAARDAKVKEESKRFMESVIGATLPNGTRTKPIDIYDDNAVESIQRQMYMNSLGMEDPYTREVATMLLKDASNVREAKIAQAQKLAEQQQSWLVNQQDEAASVGVDTSKFFTTKIDPETKQTVVTGVDQLGLSQAIAEAKLREAEKRKNEIAAANVTEEIRSDAKEVMKEIEDIDKQIREQNFMASREKNETLRDEYLAKAEYLRGERKVLVTRYSNLISKQKTGQPQLSQTDQIALDWANANPNDPRSQRIKAKLGVQ